MSIGNITGNHTGDEIRKLSSRSSIHIFPAELSAELKGEEESSEEQVMIISLRNLRSARRLSLPVQRALLSSRCEFKYGEHEPFECPFTPHGNVHIKRTKSSVSLEDIKKWNQDVGSEENEKEVKALIQRMRQLAGLEPATLEVNIPTARLGLCMLAGYDNYDYKMQCLDSLLDILKTDPYELHTATKIIRLAISMLQLMNKEALQCELVPVQIKLAEVYNILTETIHRHYGKGHINGITEDLKKELILAMKALGKLNRQENKELKYHTNCALESVTRLKGDQPALFKVVETLYRLIATIVSFQLEDAESGFYQLSQAFKHKDLQLPHSWYDAVLILKHLARDIEKSKKNLIPLLLLIGQKHSDLDWKFTYAALEILFNLVINGKSEKIRSDAFNGIKVLGPSAPGIIYFMTQDALKTYLSLKPLTHLKKGEEVNPNIYIQELCYQKLGEVIEKSPDQLIIYKAGELLLQRINKLLKINSEFTEETPKKSQEVYLKENTRTVLSQHIYHLTRLIEQCDNEKTINAAGILLWEYSGLPIADRNKLEEYIKALWQVYARSEDQETIKIIQPLLFAHTDQLVSFVHQATDEKIINRLGFELLNYVCSHAHKPHHVGEYIKVLRLVFMRSQDREIKKRTGLFLISKIPDNSNKNLEEIKHELEWLSFAMNHSLSKTLKKAARFPFLSYFSAVVSQIDLKNEQTQQFLAPYVTQLKALAESSKSNSFKDRAAELLQNFPETETVL